VNKVRNYKQQHCPNINSRSENGFTLLETAISLVIMMIIGLGIASLFTYATQSNMRADDRELAMAIAQKRMEWLRTISFTTQTRAQAYSFPNGGLAATDAAGVDETVTNAGRSYLVKTIIQDTAFVPNGQPDAGAVKEKLITLTVSPVMSSSVFEKVTLTTKRTTQVVGTY
jgi:Tfp pilus assembly protein PilV